MLQAGGDADFAQEPVGASAAATSGRSTERDSAVVSHVEGEVDDGHAATPRLALDGVVTGQSCLQPFLLIHRCLAPTRRRQPNL